MFGRTRISVSAPSPTCIAATSIIATSIGSDQVIRPGAVNWMVAGRGVSHSERTTAARPQRSAKLVGDPDLGCSTESHEDMAPAFEHHGKETLPVIEDRGVSVRLILGNAYGEARPGDDVLGDILRGCQSRGRKPAADAGQSRGQGIYIVEGSISIAGQDYEAPQMMIFRPKDRITVAAGGRGARLMILGGATLAGPRYIWWNFVASSRERIEEAKAEWRAQNWGKGRFDLPVDDRDEYIPLPD